MDRKTINFNNLKFEMTPIICSVKQIMKDMRCSKKTAIKALKELEEHGLIERRGADIIYVKRYFNA